MSSTNESFISQFGEKLLNPSTGSETSPAKALAGKDQVLMYFSAHWCPPCRRFTPVLIELYKKLKHEQNKNIEIIFCSLDRDETEYKEYSSDMPWLCMPFQAKETKILASKYKANGIPHLVVCDGSGEIITTDGTQEVQEDKKGTNFPWSPKTFSEVWPDQIHGPADALIPSSGIKDKYLMLYFSASWCPPCRAFTPKLSEAYTKLKAIRDDFEVVFVSSDRSDEDFNEYFKKMSFCALPYEHRDAKATLSKKFEVSGIPKLIMVGPVNEHGDRPVINSNARGYIENEDFDEFPFHKKNYGGVDSADDINEVKTVVIFNENGDDDDQDEIKEIVKDVAKKVQIEKKEINVCWALSPGGLSPRIRNLAGLPSADLSNDPCMIILDIPDEGGYYKSDATDITVDSVMDFIKTPGDRFQL